MASYDIFFFGACSFLLGVVLSSVGLTFEIVAGALFIGAFFTIRALISKENRKRLFWLAALSQVILLGALYVTYDGIKTAEKTYIPLGQNSEVTGTVASKPIAYSGNLRWTFEFDQPYAGKAQVTSRAFPKVSYGDRIRVMGLLKVPDEKIAKALKRSGITGAIDFPESIEIIGKKEGADVRSRLFLIRENATEVFRKTLPREEAAFLSGILLGERGELSREFKAALEHTGTMHIIALSGYNITIIVSLVMSALLLFIRRKIALLVTIIVVIGFVVMTGSEASVVRAALMGGIALLAREAGRIYDVRNAVVGAAFIMTLENPNVLVFDVGFQLSFMALLGIVYVRPVLVRFLRIQENPGVCAWRENATTTAAAQIAVAPLLISYFGSISIISLIVNALVLNIIPIAMGFGFILALVGSASIVIAIPISWITLLFLKIETGIISFFGGLSPQLRLTLPWGWWAIYYALIGYGIRKNIQAI